MSSSALRRLTSSPFSIALARQPARAAVAAVPRREQSATQRDSMEPAAPRSVGPRYGAVSSTAEGDRHFLTQWGPTPFNAAEGAPYGFNDCGPTSCLMALSALGLAPHPAPGEAEQAIDRFRDVTLGYDSKKSVALSAKALSEGMKKLGATTKRLSRPPDGDLTDIDAALSRGNPVVICGNPWKAWGEAERARGNYLNGRNPGGHWVAILGRTPQGQYVIGDPLVKGGTIAVSREQLNRFFVPAPVTGTAATEVARG